MRKVARSAIVPFPATAMFDLVADVESYPAFLPGCVGATLKSSPGNEVLATLRLKRGLLATEFTTRNQLDRPRRISMELVDGPFKALAGGWQFKEIGPDGCEIELALDFQFDNQVKDLLLGPAFEVLCSELVDAFVRRARG